MCGHIHEASSYVFDANLRWLGDLDSNQGYPGQSQVFYR